jgi:hypothetical protein
MHPNIVGAHRVNVPGLKPIVWPGRVIELNAQEKKIASGVPLATWMRVSVISVIRAKTEGYVGGTRVKAVRIVFASPSAHEKALVWPAMETLVTVNDGGKTPDGRNRYADDQQPLPSRPCM